MKTCKHAEQSPTCHLLDGKQGFVHFNLKNNDIDCP